jgi:hypothetical protein
MNLAGCSKRRLFFTRPTPARQAAPLRGQGRSNGHGAEGNDPERRENEAW